MFISGSSSGTNPIFYTEIIMEVLLGNKQVDVIYTYFCRSFNNVVHIRLIQKLETFGFHDNLIEWFNSYLSFWWLLVNFIGVYSYESSGTFVMPEGSHKDPLLFIIKFIEIIYISDSTKYP